MLAVAAFGFQAADGERRNSHRRGDQEIEALMHRSQSTSDVLAPCECGEVRHQGDAAPDLDKSREAVIHELYLLAREIAHEIGGPGCPKNAEGGGRIFEGAVDTFDLGTEVLKCARGAVDELGNFGIDPSIAQRRAIGDTETLHAPLEARTVTVLLVSKRVTVTPLRLGDDRQHQCSVADRTRHGARMG